ncbi:MAG: ribosome small subunit-dependent GTPase A [Candidatus Izemoplasmataceae bacterium]
MKTSKQSNEILKQAIISLVHRTQYVGEYEGNRVDLTIAGRFEYITVDKSDYPVVGDVVLFRQIDETKGIIERVKRRRNTLRRSGVSLTNEAQVLASNIDIIFVCMAMDEDFNMKKLSNFISLTYDVDAEVVILLTKKDVTTKEDSFVQRVNNVYKEEIMAMSIYHEADIENLEQRIGQKTAVFIGSSGVGKSSLINRLLKEDRLKVNEVRDSDAQGRHTTTHRELIHLPQGGTVIDTPGIRVVESHFVEDLDDAFEEVIALADECKFRDCKHENEPGCHVLEAIEDGILTIERFASYQKVLKLNRYHKKRDLERKRMMEKKNTYPEKG